MKYIIIGAVAGGASAAARLRRMNEQAEIILFEKGEYISYANCGLPYYIGNVIKDRNRLLVQTAAAFHRRFDVDVRVSTEVTAIDPREKKITAINLVTGEKYQESYDKLLLSPGAEPVRPDLPGINLPGIFTIRNVSDTDFIKSYITENGSGKAVVIGAGFIGLEMAENLYGLGMQVSIIEMGNQILAPVDFPVAAIVQQHIRSKGVDLRLSSTVTGFEQNGKGLTVLLKEGSTIEADLVILSIGVRPDTRLAAMAGIKLGPAKGIWVNDFLQTSDPDIYAVGDAIEFRNPVTGRSLNTYLAGPANKQGRICADNIVFGNKKKYQGSINTAIVKVFGLTVATAGISSRQLKQANMRHIVSTIYSKSHAGYYPGAHTMAIQIAFSPEDGQLYQAQIVGYDGVDKRIEAMSSVIQRGSTVYELTGFEHAYAPPYSSAKDPVNMAGFVAENILLDKMKIFYWNEIDQLPGNSLLLDVRTEQEFREGSVDGAVHIPLDELRERLNELSGYKTIYIYCQQGLRGYLAYRILQQNGFTDLYNLSGGYALWENCQKEKKISRQQVSELA